MILLNEISSYFDERIPFGRTLANIDEIVLNYFQLTQENFLHSIQQLFRHALHTNEFFEEKVFPSSKKLQIVPLEYVSFPSIGYSFAFVLYLIDGHINIPFLGRLIFHFI
jgi:hypothetical protein